MFCERWPRRMWIYMYSIGHSQDAVVMGSCQGEHLDILTAPTDYIGSPWTVSQSDKRCRLVWDLNNPHSISTTIQITLQLQKTNGRAPQKQLKSCDSCGSIPSCLQLKITGENLCKARKGFSMYRSMSGITDCNTRVDTKG